ncbi:hypothetical protein niasHS_015472 [Heterodera schachtii]|uniref:Uncharacterized protein n=1 Tax=Heterodera schachtii TaxID=97005 RepID=A0ABD2I3I0_HETSC
MSSLWNVSAVFMLITLISLLVNSSEAVPLPSKKSSSLWSKLFSTNRESAKEFGSPSSTSAGGGDEFAGKKLAPSVHSQMFIPYANNGNDGFFLPYPSEMDTVKRSNTEGHFLDPYDGGSSWLSLSEPSRLEWNFNRLR